MQIYLASKVRGLKFCDRAAEFVTSVSTVILYSGFINVVLPERENNCNLILKVNEVACTENHLMIQCLTLTLSCS
jgi:hypothetical protein